MPEEQKEETAIIKGKDFNFKKALMLQLNRITSNASEGKYMRASDGVDILEDMLSEWVSKNESYLELRNKAIDFYNTESQKIRDTITMRYMTEFAEEGEMDNRAISAMHNEINASMGRPLFMSVRKRLAALMKIMARMNLLLDEAGEDSI